MDRNELREYIGKQGERLYRDLCYAAPEMWQIQINRRMEEIISAVEADSATLPAEPEAVE